MQNFPTYKKIDFTALFSYFLFALASLCLFFVGDNSEPFALALMYALLTAHLTPIPCACIYIFPTLVSGNFFLTFLYAVQAFLLLLAFHFQEKFQNKPFIKSGVLSLLSLSLSLALFVLLAPFTPYSTPFSISSRIQTAISQKLLFSAVIFLLSAIFSITIQALLKKLLKCRLRNDELLFSGLFFIFIGVGLCKFLGVNAYMGAAFFILLLFSCITKDASTLLCAFLLSIPPFLIARLSPERFFVYGVVITLFIKSGRLLTACAALLVFFTYGYFDGLYSYETPQLISSLLSIILPALLFVLLPTPLIRILENKLIFYREKHLSRIAINRNRAAIGEKLFEFSAVFKEIEHTFTTLGTNEAEQGAKEYIRGCVMEEVCKNCPHRHICLQKGIPFQIDKLIDVGCMKGRTNVIDIPRELADSCSMQSALLQAVNRQLGDYRKYMTETENAASGRRLLANQAQGVSEILKNLALEQSEPLRMYTDKERALNVKLLSLGIVCSEVLIYGEESNLTVSLITFSRADVKRISAVISELFETPMMISERITLSQDKYCCIFRKKPYFDAAFGVATAKKSGQTASGDTHSVIKIDERRFMVALSDGMGSGEYAHQVSESTISLLESFYRAKMPPDLVLSTINRLLTFSKEETFACVDVALIDLDNGSANIVKIGSPYGFILSQNAVKVLESCSLPLGILDSLHPHTASYTLSENDVLLFLSDGITDAFGSVADLCETLKSVPTNNPQQLADALLSQALDLYAGEKRDDMTAVAVRLFKSIDIQN